MWDWSYPLSDKTVVFFFLLANCLGVVFCCIDRLVHLFIIDGVHHMQMEGDVEVELSKGDGDGTPAEANGPAMTEHREGSPTLEVGRGHRDFGNPPSVPRG